MFSTRNAASTKLPCSLCIMCAVCVFLPALVLGICVFAVCVFRMKPGGDAAKGNKLNINIIGAGPAGLSAALIFRDLPDVNINVFEKRKTEVRLFSVFVRKEALERLQKQSPYFRDDSVNTAGATFPDTGRFAGGMVVRMDKLVNVLEASLPNGTVHRGNDFKAGSVVSPAEGEVNIYVLAEGARAALGDNLLGATSVEALESVAYGMGVLFRSDTPRNTFQSRWDDPLVCDQDARHQRFGLFETKLPPEDPFREFLSLQLTQNEFDTVKEFGFKSNAAEMAGMKDIPEQMQELLKFSLNGFGFDSTAIAWPDLRLWAFPVKLPYRSSYARSDSNQAILRIGDAAYGVHFRSGMGCTSAIRQADKLYQMLQKDMDMREVAVSFQEWQQVQQRTLHTAMRNNVIDPFIRNVERCKALVDDFGLRQECIIGIKSAPQRQLLD